MYYEILVSCLFGLANICTGQTVGDDVPRVAHVGIGGQDWLAAVVGDVDVVLIGVVCEAIVVDFQRLGQYQTCLFSPEILDL